MQKVLNVLLAILHVAKDELLHLTFEEAQYKSVLEDILYRLQDVITDVAKLERQIPRDRAKAIGTVEGKGE